MLKSNGTIQITFSDHEKAQIRLKSQFFSIKMLINEILTTRKSSSTNHRNSNQMVNKAQNDIDYSQMFAEHFVPKKNVEVKSKGEIYNPKLRNLPPSKKNSLFQTNSQMKITSNTVHIFCNLIDANDKIESCLLGKDSETFLRISFRNSIGSVKVKWVQIQNLTFEKALKVILDLNA